MMWTYSSHEVDDAAYQQDRANAADAAAILARDAALVASNQASVNEALRRAGMAPIGVTRQSFPYDY